MSFFSQVKQLIYDSVSELWVSAPGDAANGLDVDVTRLPVNALGAIGKVQLVADFEGEPMDISGSNNALVVTFYNTLGTPVGAVKAIDESSEILDGTDSALPKRVKIAASSSGNNTLVAAVADYKIRVLALSLSASGAVNAKFQSAAGGTDITGLYYLTTNSQLVLPYNKLGWFETAASALLNLNLSGAVAVGGCLTYIEVA